jgi:hypothetical protein
MSDTFDEQEPVAAEMNPPEPTKEEIEAQAEAERRAKHMAHPHTQLKGILADLNPPRPTALDMPARMSLLHGAMTRLVQIILTHTPPPEES